MKLVEHQEWQDCLPFLKLKATVLFPDKSKLCVLEAYIIGGGGSLRKRKQDIFFNLYNIRTSPKALGVALEA